LVKPEELIGVSRLPIWGSPAGLITSDMDVVLQLEQGSQQITVTIPVLKASGHRPLVRFRQG
jgi:hypothetical protein